MRKRKFAITSSLILASVLISSHVQAQPPGQGRGPDGPGGPGGPGDHPGGEGGRMGPHPIVMAIDKNGDHVIDAEELKAAVESLLALDKNGDGELRDEELRPPMGAQRERGRAGGRSPGGPDGQRGPGGPARDPAKFVEHAMEFDADKDGKLSPEELLVFAKQMASHRPGGPEQSGGPAQTDRPQRGGGQRGERPQRPGFDN